MKLSKHFLQKWINFFGYEPETDMVKGMIDNAVVVQKFRVVRKIDGSVYKVAQIYWDLKDNILFKVDEDTKTVITFISSQKTGGVYARA
jgi:hypothetical protein